MCSVRACEFVYMSVHVALSVCTILGCYRITGEEGQVKVFSPSDPHVQQSQLHTIHRTIQV